MTLSGLFMLIFSVSLVTLLVTWCYYKVFNAANNDDQDLGE